MGCETDFRSAIIAAAQSAGVDPNIALQIASRESGICQWWDNGTLKIGGAGEIGIFQIKPATAIEVGYSNPADPSQNIAAGVAYLRKMLDRYGNYSLAIAAYNYGPGNVDAALRNGTALPGVVQQYVAATNQPGVSPATVPVASFNYVPTPPPPTRSSVNPLAFVGVLAGALALAWIVD